MLLVLAWTGFALWFMAGYQLGKTKERKSYIKSICPHDEWDMDNQIRVIKCKKCGKKAWVRDTKNLFS